jgi:hypothetical protein
LRNAHRHKERILTREQTIRYHQANDRALWLMIKDRQENAEEKHLDVDLQDLKLVNLETVLDKPINVKGTVPTTDVQIVEELPIRRYGDLRRVLKDRRLATLVTYYDPKKEIEHETIKNEFLTYDLERVKFFEEIYKFEEAVYKAFKDEFPPMVNGEYDDKKFMSKYGVVVEEREKMKKYYPHNVFMRIATDHLTDKEDAAHYNENVVQLRNKFLHNQIPYFDWLTGEVQNEATPLMCDKIFVVAKRYYKELRRKVIR